MDLVRNRTKNPTDVVEGANPLRMWAGIPAPGFSEAMRKMGVRDVEKTFVKIREIVAHVGEKTNNQRCRDEVRWMEARYKDNGVELDEVYTTREWLCVNKEKLQSIKYVINRMRTHTGLKNIVESTTYTFGRGDFKRTIVNI